MKQRNILLFGIVFGIFCALPFFSSADEDAALARKSEERNRIEQEIEKYRSEFSDLGSENLSLIREKIDAEIHGFDSYQRKTEEIEGQISELKEKITTLEGQLRALDLASESARQQVEMVKIRIMQRVADIKFLSEEKEKITAEKERALRAILFFFSLLQTDSDEFGLEDETRNTLRLLLSDESFSQNFWKSEENAALERTGRKIFHDFEEKEEELKEVEDLLSLENIRLSELHDQKRREEKNLSTQITATKKLKNETEISEEEFQKLLEESREQMRKNISEIDRLRSEYSSIEKKLNDFEKAEEEKAKEEDDFFQKVEEVSDQILTEENTKKPFDWPIKPKKGLSAVFLDSEYEEIFGIPHKAIDIPTPQGTDIIAPALGYVYKVSDNGDGYSSLIVAHQNNLLTVYGHISEFLVKEGDLVRAGDVLALSGGMPGTPGAGWMTTGPHLHFEVIKNGENLDPLDFLPPVPKIEDLEIMEKEVSEILGDQEDVVIDPETEEESMIDENEEIREE